eukprot:1147892-Pelagomonas_calceolata.AAC.1
MNLFDVAAANLRTCCSACYQTACYPILPSLTLLVLHVFFPAGLQRGWCKGRSAAQGKRSVHSREPTHTHAGQGLKKPCVSSLRSHSQCIDAAAGIGKQRGCKH